MSGKLEVRAFQIAVITGHGAACSDDFDDNWARELRSNGGRYAVIPAEFYKAFEPVVGSWVVEHASGRLVFPTAEAFARDYEWVADDRYLTSWRPLFSDAHNVDRPKVLAVDGKPEAIVITNEDDLSYAAYLDALSKVVMEPLDFAKHRLARK